jgi:hypothetical protein
MDPHDAPDAALAARLADDLDGTFEELVHVHVARLYTIALRILGDRRDAWAAIGRAPCRESVYEAV